MDTLFSEAIKQAPSLGVLAFVVYTFLKHLRGEGELNRASLEKMADSIGELQTSNDRLSKIIILHDATVRGTNDDTMGSHAEIMGELTERGD